MTTGRLPRPPRPPADPAAPDRRGALVLTRHVDQDFYLDFGDGRVARVVVTRVAGTQVRLCVEAPVSVRILRGELAAAAAAERPPA